MSCYSEMEYSIHTSLTAYNIWQILLPCIKRWTTSDHWGSGGGVLCKMRHDVWASGLSPVWFPIGRPSVLWKEPNFGQTWGLSSLWSQMVYPIPMQCGSTNYPWISCRHEYQTVSVLYGNKESVIILAWKCQAIVNSRLSHWNLIEGSLHWIQHICDLSPIQFHLISILQRIWI